MNPPIVDNPSLNPSEDFKSFVNTSQENFLELIDPCPSAKNFIQELKISKSHNKPFVNPNFLNKILGEAFILNIAFILTIAIFPLISSLQQNLNKDRISSISVHQTEIFRSQAYFNVISGFFIIMLLLLLRKKDLFLERRQNKSILLENLPICNNVEESLMEFFQEKGYFLEKISFIFDCSQLLKLQSTGDFLQKQAIIEKKENSTLFEMKLEELDKKRTLLRSSSYYRREKFVNKVFITLQKETDKKKLYKTYGNHFFSRKNLLFKEIPILLSDAPFPEQVNWVNISLDSQECKKPFFISLIMMLFGFFVMLVFYAFLSFGQETVSKLSLKLLFSILLGFFQISYGFVIFPMKINFLIKKLSFISLIAEENAYIKSNVFGIIFLNCLVWPVIQLFFQRKEDLLEPYGVIFNFTLFFLMIAPTTIIAEIYCILTRKYLKEETICILIISQLLCSIFFITIIPIACFLNLGLVLFNYLFEKKIKINVTYLKDIIVSQKILESSIFIMGVGALVFQNIANESLDWWNISLGNLIIFIIGVLFFISPIEKFLWRVWGEENQQKNIFLNFEEQNPMLRKETF